MVVYVRRCWYLMSQAADHCKQLHPPEHYIRNQKNPRDDKLIHLGGNVLDRYILVVWHGVTEFTILSKIIYTLVTKLGFFSHSWFLL